MKLSGKKLAVVVVAAVAVVIAIGAGTWLAMAGDDEAFTSGKCDSSSYRLEVDKENDAHEVSFEVQSTAPGETWQIAVEHDGTSLLEGERQTDEDAEIDVDVIVPDLAEGDVVTATATPASDGAACTATLTR
ncbi:MAG: hypothetical protein JWO76_930 [Nocardioides sp.]|nr:hypothetical protein [Nocardioides sp.]